VQTILGPVLHGFVIGTGDMMGGRNRFLGDNGFVGGVYGEQDYVGAREKEIGARCIVWDLSRKIARMKVIRLGCWGCM